MRRRSGRIRNSVRTLQTADLGPQSHGCVRAVCQLGGDDGHQRQTVGGTDVHKLGGGQVRREGQIGILTNWDHAQETGGRHAGGARQREHARDAVEQAQFSIAVPVGIGVVGRSVQAVMEGGPDLEWLQWDCTNAFLGTMFTSPAG